MDENMRWHNFLSIIDKDKKKIIILIDNKIENKKLEEKLNEKKFIIIDILMEKHNTCFIIFKDKTKNKYYLCFINSGLNLNYHEQYKTYYKPYKLI